MINIKILSVTLLFYLFFGWWFSLLKVTNPFLGLKFNAKFLDTMCEWTLFIVELILAHALFEEDPTDSGFLLSLFLNLSCLFMLRCLFLILLVFLLRKMQDLIQLSFKLFPLICMSSEIPLFFLLHITLKIKLF